MKEVIVVKYFICSALFCPEMILSIIAFRELLVNPFIPKSFKIKIYRKYRTFLLV